MSRWSSRRRWDWIVASGIGYGRVSAAGGPRRTQATARVRHLRAGQPLLSDHDTRKPLDAAVDRRTYLTGSVAGLLGRMVRPRLGLNEELINYSFSGGLYWCLDSPTRPYDSDSKEDQSCNGIIHAVPVSVCPLFCPMRRPPAFRQCPGELVGSRAVDMGGPADRGDHARADHTDGPPQPAERVPCHGFTGPPPAWVRLVGGPAFRRKRPGRDLAGIPLLVSGFHAAKINGSRTNRRTISQIVFRFAVDFGMVALTGTTDAGHMREDLDVFNFRLDPEEVERIERLHLA
jgi:hypothetical protein